MSRVKELVSNGKRVFFRACTQDSLWYRCEDGTDFPVPLSDCEGAVFYERDKALLFMRWIRKHLENPVLTPPPIYVNFESCGYVTFNRFESGFLRYQTLDGIEVIVHPTRVPQDDRGTVPANVHYDCMPERVYSLLVEDGRVRAKFARGTRVRVTRLNDSSGWSEGARASRKAGVDGVVMGYSDSHGLCFEVAHGDTTSYYDPSELEVVTPET